MELGTGDARAPCPARVSVAGGAGTFEATEEAQEEWAEQVRASAEGTMYTTPTCKSWYVGANVEGKVRQMGPYAGGLSTYIDICRRVQQQGYAGFSVG